MDPEARQYQNQLHQANERRMLGVEDKLDTLIKQSTETNVLIRALPSLEERVADLEAERNQRKGAMAMLGVIGGAVGAGLIKVLELFFHR